MSRRRQRFPHVKNPKAVRQALGFLLSIFLIPKEGEKMCIRDSPQIVHEIIFVFKGCSSGPAQVLSGAGGALRLDKTEFCN